MRAAAARLGLVVLGLLVAAAVVEIGVRVFGLGSPAGELRGLHVARPDRPWLYGMQPGAERRLSVSGDVTYTVNADGFRDRSYALVKPEGTVRILVLGDSIAFGYGVALEKTFAKLLERRLAGLQQSLRYEVLSLGVSGYNPYTEAALFSDVGVKYAPDLVLVAFCVNDLNDPTLHFDASTMLRVGAIPDVAFPDPSQRRPPEPPSLAIRLCRSSRLCSLALDRWRPPSRSELERMGAALAPHEEPSATELAWLGRIYSGLSHEAEALGARFVLIVFPYRTQIDPGAPDTLQRSLAGLAREHGWPMIDLLPAYRRAAATSPEPLFIDLWHPTARGQEVAADAILSALRCAGLLPGIAPVCDPA